MNWYRIHLWTKYKQLTTKVVIQPPMWYEYESLIYFNIRMSSVKNRYCLNDIKKQTVINLNLFTAIFTILTTKYNRFQPTAVAEGFVWQYREFGRSNGTAENADPGVRPPEV